MSSRLFHNPRCSKSRAALSLLQERGVDVEIYAYLNDPPSAKKLRDLAKLLGLASPREMMRVKETAYKDQSLAEADDNALFAAMAAAPILIERPIFVHGGRAVIGRPPERVLDLL